MLKATSNTRITVKPGAPGEQERKIVIHDFSKQFEEIVQKTERVGSDHNDDYLNYFVVALKFAREGMFKDFAFPLKGREYVIKLKNPMDDYSEREDIFKGLIGLCNAYLFDFIHYASDKQIESLRLILKLTTQFRNKTITDIGMCFKDAQFSLGELRS
jgi:hypothetical protein